MLKSATFRTADIVGLDTLKNVSLTTYDKAQEDEERDIFQIPAILESLIASDRLGQKTKAGFYKKNEDRSIHSVDLKTGEYNPMGQVDLTASESQKTGNDYRIKLQPCALVMIEVVNILGRLLPKCLSIAQIAFLKFQMTF